MIQRIQSIYLFLATLTIILSFFFSTAHFVCTQETITQTFHLYAFSVTSNGTYPPTTFLSIIPILGVLSALLPLIAIFLFRHRRLQMRLAIYATLFALLYLISFGVEIYTLQQEFIRQNFIVHLTPTTILCFPAFAIICNILAYKAIKHDENLIRSVDRIR